MNRLKFTYIAAIVGLVAVFWLVTTQFAVEPLVADFILGGK